MILWGLVNLFIALLLAPLVVKEEDRCTATNVLYYSCCASFTFLGGILVFFLFKRIVSGR